jgi:hypothetical protein
MSLLLMLGFVGLSVGAALDQVWIVSAILGLPALLLALLVAQDCAAATAVTLRTLRAMEAEEQSSYAPQELPAPDLLRGSNSNREAELPLVRAHSIRTGGN